MCLIDDDDFIRSQWGEIESCSEGFGRGIRAELDQNADQKFSIRLFGWTHGRTEPNLTTMSK